MTEQTIRVIGHDGSTLVAELVRQEGGNAAALRAKDEDWHTPETLDQIAAACSSMASIIRGA